MKRILLIITLIFNVGFNFINAQETLNCDLETYELLKSLSDSKLANGKVLLFTNTHQDLAWIDEPEKCKIFRDTLWLTPFLDRLRSEPEFKMDIEQVSIVRDYFERQPGKKEEFIKFLSEGRIAIGGAYNSPYEEMYSGESLARQFYLGKKWMEDNLNGYQPTTYFNVDVPGRTAQMPQLVKKAGIDNFLISRHLKGYYNWQALDGSKVRVYSPGHHYMDFYNLLGMEDADAIKKMAKDAVSWYEIYNDNVVDKAIMPVMLNYEFIWDQEPVQNCGPFMKKWNSIRYIKTEGKKRIAVKLPNIIYGTADEFFNKGNETTEVKQTIKGERPNAWIYIHGASHQKTLKASREGDILLTQAEKFATANALIDGSFKRYPENDLQSAWLAKIYPDHGFGGKGGDITDNLFLQKYLFSQLEASKVLDKSLREIAGKINFDKNEGTPIVVFNSLSWERTDPVDFEVKFEQKELKGVSLYDDQNNVVPIQLLESSRFDDGSLKYLKARFLAKELPSIGYRTYYLKSNDSQIVANKDLNSGKLIENDFYRITFANGGVSSIYDKELKVELIDDSKFKAGEVFEMNSVGTGAGEFSLVQQPDTTFFEQLGTGTTHWVIDKNGPVFTSVKMRQKMKEAVVEMEVIIYNEIKKIDFKIDLKNWDGVLYREFRMAMPLNMENGKVTYEVPFGAVTVGEDEHKGNGGEMYNSPVKDIRPRGIANWISASNEVYGVTLSSSVVTADYIDPTDTLSKKTILQTILLASRRSCHNEGNEYLQTGSHQFNFSLTSHKPGWKNGQRFGVEANERLHSISDPETYKTAELSEKLSFFKTDKDNVVISTIKKAEDDHSVVIRAYETDGDDVDVAISMFKPITKAFLTNLIEQPKREIKIEKQKIELNLGNNSIETIKVE